LLAEAKNWPRYSPLVRAAAIAALSAKPALLGALFDAVERGTIAPTDVAPTKRAQLLKHSNAAIRVRAEVAFKRIEAGDRMQVYQAQRSVLALAGDAVKGREVFLRVCATCHTRGGVGGKVGPDLTGIRNQPAEAILLHTLVPNFEVAPAFQAMIVETSDGRSLTGWIAAETDNALTLRTAAGSEELVLRSNLASLTAAGVSLMPDGLEQAMTREELAGLIAFLKTEQ
jgi:putative heme-binding domain-containing protein